MTNCSHLNRFETCGTATLVQQQYPLFLTVSYQQDYLVKSGEKQSSWWHVPVKKECWCHIRNHFQNSQQTNANVKTGGTNLQLSHLDKAPLCACRQLLKLQCMNPHPMTSTNGVTGQNYNCQGARYSSASSSGQKLSPESVWVTNHIIYCISPRKPSRELSYWSVNLTHLLNHPNELWECPVELIQNRIDELGCLLVLCNQDTSYCLLKDFWWTRFYKQEVRKEMRMLCKSIHGIARCNN